jgi:hypothetical protein
VRLETILRGNDSERHYQCGGCAFAWRENDAVADADRRKRLTQRRTVLRGERRKF